MKFNRLGGSALFIIETKLAYIFIDSFFGGFDKPVPKMESKDFTPIELKIIRKVVDIAISDLEQAWAQVKVIGCAFTRTELNPQFIGIVPPTDVVIVSTFDVEFDNSTGTIMIVIPYATIEPIKKRLSNSFQIESDQDERSVWADLITERLMNVNAEVRVDLGSANMDIKQIINLKKGDVIGLDSVVTDEMPIQIEGMKKLRGYYGVHHGNRAMKVTKRIKE